MNKIKYSVIFHPEKRKVKGMIRTVDVPLVMSIAWQGDRVTYYPGPRIDIANWDHERQYLSDDQDDADSIRVRINGLKQRIDDFFTMSSIEGRSVEEISRAEVMDILKGNKTIGKRYKVLELYSEFLNDQKVLADKGSRPISTYKKYQTVFNHLGEFISLSMERKDVSFSEVNYDFMESFTNFLLKPHKKSKIYKRMGGEGLTNNTIAKDVKILKSFLNWGLAEGKHKTDSFKNYSYAEDDPDIVSLNWDELLKLYYAEMPQPYLERVRDVWAFMAVTSLSYVDCKKLTPANVYPDGTLRMVRQKTHRLTYTIKDKQRKSRKPKQLIIPLTFISKAVIEKYRDHAESTGSLLPVISNQKMNDYIKEACEIAGIDEITTITRGRGKESVIIGPMPKHQFVLTKVARKTFTSIAFILNMPVELVKQITGHSTSEVLERHYLKIFPEHLQREMERVFDTLRKKAESSGGSYLKKVD